MKTLKVVLASTLLIFSCQKRISFPPPDANLPAGIAPETPSPEEPVQRLAWQATQRLKKGIQNLHVTSTSIQISDILFQVNWPDPAATYLKNSLQNQLQNAGIKVSENSDLILGGTVFQKGPDIVFAFTLNRNGTPLFSDSASTPDDQRLQNTLAQFQQPHTHAEAKIPTPLAQLKEIPLDLLPFCRQGICSLILLYPYRVEILDWRNGQTKSVFIQSQFFSGVRSRSPSGKILHYRDGFLVMHNGLTSPLYFSEDLQRPPVVLTDKPAWLPLPEPARNSYVLRDGQFFDFDLIQENRFVVIDTQNRFSLATGGKLLYSNTLVGGTFCAAFPFFYVSSATSPGEPDAILMFSSQNEGSIRLESTRPVPGEIIDLAFTDLNQDNESELLVTLRKSNGVFIEVHQPF